MQRKIAHHVLKQLQSRGWTGGVVVRLRDAHDRLSSVYAISIDAPDGTRLYTTALDEVRLKVRLLDEHRHMESDA